MKAFERLLKYTAIRTPSDEESDTVPSSACQFELAHHLYRELFTMGITDVKVDTQCYLYAHIPATPGYEDRPKLGFIAHLDTVSDFCDRRIIAEIHEDYNGRELPLGTSGRVLSPDMFPHLKDLKGRTLITSDGTTILGADNKAGIAEIMTMAERILDENIPHGPVSIAFTPDEEIGMGAAHFDVEEFGADFAYTLDGDTEGEVGHAVLRYIIRDHDAAKFEERKETLRNIEKKINQKWGRGATSLTITDQYRNMAEIIAGCMHLIENAKKACRNAGVTPLILPIRGGTDGAQLSFKGLPCPNLGTGGHGYHGPYEHITVDGMDAACEVALELVKIYAEKSAD